MKITKRTIRIDALIALCVFVMLFIINYWRAPAAPVGNHLLKALILAAVTTILGVIVQLLQKKQPRSPRKTNREKFFLWILMPVVVFAFKFAIDWLWPNVGDTIGEQLFSAARFTVYMTAIFVFSCVDNREDKKAEEQ